MTSRARTRQTLGQYVAGFSAVTAIGVLIGALSPYTDPLELLASAVGLLVLAAVALLAPWRRLPEWAPATVPIAYYGVFAVLRDGAGASHSAMTPLLMLPLIWLALYGTPRQLLFGVAALVATVALPIVLIGGSAYPADGWRSVALWAVVAPLTGFTVQHLVAGQRRTQAALSDSEARHRLLVQNLPDAVISLYDRDLRCVLVEGALSVAREADGYVGRHVSEIVPEARLAVLEPELLRALAGETSEFEYESGGGERIWHATVAPYRREDGAIDGAFSVWRDVTARRQAEVAVLAAEEHFRGAFEHAPVGMVVSTPDGRVLDVNHAFTALLGLERSELLGLRWDDILHPEEPGLENATHGERYVTRLLRGDSSVVEVAVRTVLERDAAGRPSRLLAHVLDIEESKRTERARETQLALSSVLAGASTEDEALAQALPAICDALGWDGGECWLDDGDADGLDGLPRLVWDTGRSHWVEDLRLALGSPRARSAVRDGWRSAIAVPVRSEGKLLGVVELLHREVRRHDPVLLELLGSIGSQLGEFIGRKRAERSAEQLKDEFFAAVSHELRTPLTSIVGYLEVVLDDEELDPTHQRFLSVVERNAQRLVRLVGDLLFVAQIEAGTARIEPVEMDLATVASEAVESAQPRALAGGVTVELECPSFAPIHGDPNRIAQALDNLISNAIKFTGEGGFVEVRVRPGESSTTLEVQDSGVGIPEDEQGRLFERFFRASTATSRVPGVGLGLTIVKAIIEAHEGTLAVSSREGAGTIFRVELPGGTGNTGALEFSAAVGG